MKHPTLRRPSLLLLSMLMGSVAGCGAGPYGFSRYYEPIKQEKSYHEKAQTFTSGAVTSRPQDYTDKLIGWFGIVEKVEATKDGHHLVRLSYHAHKSRHLCETEVSSSCRVTVHYKSTGGFSALLDLRPEDMIPGLDKVQPGTLMRVFGKVQCERIDRGKHRCERDEQGNVLLKGEYYRQWPARYYRTTRTANRMRR